MPTRRRRGGVRVSRSSAPGTEAERDLAHSKKASAARDDAAQQRTLPNSAIQRLVDRQPEKPQQAPKMGGPMGKLMKAIAAAHIVKQGAVGFEVMILQIRLNALGASPKLAVDGIFGPKTRRAVVMFQKRNHLVPDGVVGRHTRAAIHTLLDLQATIAAVRAALGSLHELGKRVAAFAGEQAAAI
jgi:peptidoglycan hydrolase-like protein with peptidoglycan-binding domain